MNDLFFLNNLLTFIYSNWFAITVVVMLVIYRKKLLWEPLAGGNGKVQMDEIGKAILLVAFCWALWKEGTRNNLEQRIFDDGLFLILVGAVFSIANIKIDINSLMNRQKETPK